ncbi:MAG: phosphoglucosamine mutase [Deltaproteobacteria bacterium]|nr:phosphoglucosamine mutase [Deltaproteobacteria bacterium]MCL5277098.1 phosphoglucosamine mutase [Deltaproteobacteria bacterium]
MNRLFGTDGVRGTANKEPMTVETVLKLGKAASALLSNGRAHHKFIIGKDTRLSGYMFEMALTAGITSMGGDVLLTGPFPTPGIAYLTTEIKADVGIVISASHNPYMDNGIKFFGSDGYKLNDTIESEIERLVLSGSTIRPPRPEERIAENIGKAYRLSDAMGRYIVFLKHSFPKEISLSGIRMAVDCANGATYRVAPAVFQELGASIAVVCAQPNGKNINHNCGSTHPDLIASTAKKYGADIGVAFDGDGDRAILCDEKGNIVDGDAILAMTAIHMKNAGRLKGNGVVSTVMSNIGLELALKQEGIKLIRAEVGDRYVLESMLREGIVLGGEQSGHIIFIEHNTAGDGIITALQVLAIMVLTGRKLSELAGIMSHCPQVMINVRVTGKPPLKSMPDAQRLIQGISDKLKDSGRVLVRYSGTEPLVRVMVEGPEHSLIQGYAQEIADTFKKLIGDKGPGT